MLTPIEIHNTQHKQGRGYSKKEMDAFLEQIASDYEELYKENIELKEKIDKQIVVTKEKSGGSRATIVV